MNGHTGTCGTAVNPGCTCPCLHAQHGLHGRLAWARALESNKGSPDRTAAELRRGTATTRLGERIAQSAKSKKQIEERLNSEKQSQKSGEPKKSSGLSKINAKHAFEFARTVCMVDWLVEHPTERAQLQSVVGLLIKASTKLLANKSDIEKARIKKHIWEHLWCDLIASIVIAIDKVDLTVGQTTNDIAIEVAAAATELLVSAWTKATAQPAQGNTDGQLVTPDAGSDVSLESAILKGCIQGCIQGIVKIALKGATGGLGESLKTIQLKLRIAAVLLCPEPDEHEEVWEHCWLPLWKEAVLGGLLTDLADLIPELKADYLELKAAAGASVSGATV